MYLWISSFSCPILVQVAELVIKTLVRRTDLLTIQEVEKISVGSQLDVRVAYIRVKTYRNTFLLYALFRSIFC